MTSRWQRSIPAAWLGLAAPTTQAVVPLVIAVESSLAAKASESSVFPICEYGGIEPGAPPDAEKAPGKSHRHDNGDGLCPICIALLAAPVFTAPAVLAVPLPAVRQVATAVAELRSSPRPFAPAAYRSRAPPIG